MTLYIDTTKNDLIRLALKAGKKLMAEKELAAPRAQAEKLLAGIEKMLKAKKLKLEDIKKIEVANRGGSFTSLRVGVVTANALNYALGFRPLRVIKPEYDREPEITTKRVTHNS